MRVCAVVGIGPGNGSSLASRWAAEGHRVALLSRNEQRLAEYEARIPNSKGIVCDAAEPASVEQAFARVRDELGPVDTLLYNAGSGVWGSLSELGVQALDGAYRVNVAGLFLAAKQVVPDMVRAGRGTIGVVGASAAWRGRAKTLAFAAAKAAQRSLAQSLARDLGPKGIHVFYMIIDGMIDLESTRQMLPDKGDEAFIQAGQVAAAAWAISRQDPSAWTFELDLRPFRETW